MKQTINEYQFIEAFKHAGRESQFTVSARRALFAYLEDYEKQSGTDLELDPIGICCEFAEYPSALEAAETYGYLEGIDSKEETPLEWLRNRTQVIDFGGGIVIQQF